MTLVLLESLRSADQRSFIIQDPEIVLRCNELSEVRGVLKQIEQAVINGYMAVGFLTYEAGFALLPHMPAISQTDFPLAWFALTRNLTKLQPETLMNDPSFSEERFAVEDLGLTLELPQYREAIEAIRRQIENGDTYQVNFTMRYRGKFSGSTRALYRQLRAKQRVDYAAYIETPEWAILSLSPELFFHRRGNEIQMRPMKGTASRGRTLEEDDAKATELRESPKEQSENLMIVDLLRNDLGKISETGSIQVIEPMQIERYETLLQMTSTIIGQVSDHISLADIFTATFPSGSVTGAPKIRTMQIIHELEKEPRGIYTGSIGLVSQTESIFNVAIRTIWIDRKKGQIEMGVGGGILHEADARREYDECKLKGKFLTDAPLDFQLLETILWEPETGFRYLPLHLDRLCKSAKYFLFPADRPTVEIALKKAAAKFAGPQRVRLLMDPSGKLSISAEPLTAIEGRPRIRFSKSTVNSADRFLYHKTTNRKLYEEELTVARSEGFFDVIFRNERNEITEGAISNVMIRKSGRYFTPPVSCGLLPGIFRQHLLQTQPLPLEERILREHDVLQADCIYLTNAIRGMFPVFR